MKETRTYSYMHNKDMNEWRKDGFLVLLSVRLVNNDDLIVMQKQNMNRN